MDRAQYTSSETYRGLVRRALPSIIPAYVVLAIPPNPGVRTGPFIATNICLAILVALIIIGRRWDRRGSQPAVVRLATTAAAMSAIGLGIWAWDGREASLVPIFFVVVAFGAAMGGRLYLVFGFVTTVMAYALGMWAAGEDVGYVASSTLVVASCVVCLQICVRFAVTRSIQLAEDNDLQRRIVAAAAHANDLTSGLAEMAPLAARLLGTDYVCAEAIDQEGRRRVLARVGQEPAAVPGADGTAQLDLGPTAGREHVVLVVGLEGRPASQDLEVVTDLLTPLVARTRYVANLERIAASDSLTGVASRRELARVLARLRAEDEPHAVVMMDVNGLKEYNDTLGHVAGDDILAKAGQLLQDLGPSVTAARYGGDEFILVIEGGGLADAEDAVRRLDANWAESIPIGVSFGVAEWDRSESSTALIERADIELYRAKRAARDPISH